LEKEKVRAKANMNDELIFYKFYITAQNKEKLCQPRIYQNMELYLIEQQIKVLPQRAL
jgi:hypothetical protein